jgi:hypothetical protein
MKWLKRQIYRWVQDVRNEEEKLLGGMTLNCEAPEPAWSDGLRVTVKRVIGGSVVSFRTYDRRRDESNERHYIITDEQEFDRELGKMITMESMRQS